MQRRVVALAAVAHLLVLLHTVPLAHAGFSGIFPDVPSSMAPGVAGVDPAFECSWRQMAYDHAKALLPRHGARGFLAAFDALRLNELCGVPRPPAPAQPMPPSAAPIPPVSHIFYVDYTHGADSNSGAINAPLKTVAAAVTRRAAVQPAGQPAAIVLRSGVHVLSATIEFTTAHANTTITNYPGEQVIVTGAQPLRISNWKPYRVQQSNGCDTVSGVCLFNNTNDISGTYPSPLLYNASRTQTPEECAGLCARNASCLSFTWNSNIYPLEWNSTCWFRTDVHYWAPNVEGNHMAGCKPGIMPNCFAPNTSNIFVADLAGQNISLIRGLHLISGAPNALNLSRAILARHPNSDPEGAPFYINDAPSWISPASSQCDSAIVHQTNLPDNYPGMFQDFYLGVNGTCDMYQVDNSSYWCQPYGRTAGTTYCARHPLGMTFNPADFPGVNTTFSNLEAAQLNAFRGAGEWFTWAFEVESYNAASHTFNFGRGGFQGAEGSSSGGRWYLEGIPELLDSPSEFYYDAANSLLYYWPNTTIGVPPPASDNLFYATTLEELFRVIGTQEEPVTNVVIRGLTLTGTARTELAPHGVPSGGDWALEQLAAVHLEGTERVTVVNCTFQRLDGNAVLALGYHRNLSIVDSDFSFIGNSAIVQWGFTNYSDATIGTQPIGTLVTGNVFHDIGHYQKQSSGYFQARSCLNTVTRNVMFNMPRAAINFNDGMGGGSESSWNLLFNTCRESNDHSTFNSWDRMPFVTTYRYGRPSIEGIPNNIHHNFHVANYGANGGGIDTDDGSSWYQVHHNFFVYGGHKSDFDGHGKVSYGNLNAYSYVYEVVCASISSLPLATPDGHMNEGYYNNTCILPAGARYFSVGGCNSTVAANATAFTFNMGHNKVYIQGANPSIGCGDISTLEQWQKTGRDVDTQIFDAATAAQIIGWAKELLWPVPPS